MDDWAAKTFLDKATGLVYREYTYKRKPCVRIVLSSRVAQQLAGWTLIDKDLRSIVVWLDEIDERHKPTSSSRSGAFTHSQDREKFNLIKGLFVAVLTFYGKCFASCDGRQVKMDRAQLDRRFHEIHDRYISFRHNFAAHSGAARIEKVDIALVFPKKFHKKVTPRIYRELEQPDLAWGSETDNREFRELIEHIRSIVQKKIDALNKKLITEEASQKHDEHWKKKGYR